MVGSAHRVPAYATCVPPWSWHRSGLVQRHASRTATHASRVGARFAEPTPITGRAGGGHASARAAADLALETDTLRPDAHRAHREGPGDQPGRTYGNGEEEVATVHRRREAARGPGRVAAWTRHARLYRRTPSDRAGGGTRRDAWGDRPLAAVVRGRGSRGIGDRQTAGRRAAADGPQRDRLCGLIEIGPHAAGYTSGVWTARARNRGVGLAAGHEVPDEGVVGGGVAVGVGRGSARRRWFEPAREVGWNGPGPSGYRGPAMPPGCPRMTPACRHGRS